MTGALGAPSFRILTNNGKVPIKRCGTWYWGRASTTGAIESALKTYKLALCAGAGSGFPWPRKAAHTGRILDGSRAHGVWPARAEGSRSILADPRDPEMNAKVNNAVKFREWWRPFAPSFKKEAAGEYLESATDSPFMIVTAQVRPEKRSVIPSVTHVDGQRAVRKRLRKRSTHFIGG